MIWLISFLSVWEESQYINFKSLDTFDYQTGYRTYCMSFNEALRKFNKCYISLHSSCFYCQMTITVFTPQSWCNWLIHHSPHCQHAEERRKLLSPWAWVFLLKCATNGRRHREHFSLSYTPIIWKVEQRLSVSRWLAAYRAFLPALSWRLTALQRQPPGRWQNLQHLQLQVSSLKPAPEYPPRRTKGEVGF